MVDLKEMRALAAVWKDADDACEVVEALLAACDEIAAWRRVTGAGSPEDAALFLANTRARVRGKPDRGTLIVRLASAGAARVDAARGVDNAPARGDERAAAIERFNAADAEEQRARADLEAFEAEMRESLRGDMK